MNAKGIDPRSLTLSRHAKTQARAKGFTVDQLVSALRNPDKVTDVTRYPGQRRWCGAGVAVIVNVRDRVIVTVYADGIRTPLRPDQMNDPVALASNRALR